MAAINHSTRRRKYLIIVSVLVVFLVLARLILPYIVLHYANRTLASIKGYYGHIETIDLALIRGAYKIRNVYLNKEDSATRKQTKFFSASLIDLSVEWGALFHGSIVGNVTFENAELQFTKDKVEPKHLRKDSSKLKNLRDKFMPLKVNRFEVNHGAIRYRDENSKPKVDISMTDTHILALNLRNSYSAGTLLPATVLAQARVYHGTLDLNMKLNPLAEDPTFYLSAELKNTNLPDLNEFFDAYANVKMSKGTFGLYTEVAAKNGNFKGYVKPIIKNLKVTGDATKHDSVLKKIWEGFVGTVAHVVTNHPKKQLATKIPFEGRLKEPYTDVWYSIGHVLENAFVRAIVPAIDHDISIASVEPVKKKKTFFEKLFGSKDKKKKDSKN